jgi:FMN reductase
VPVCLLALGGTDRHALVIEHQMRPLFGFFGAKTLATGVFMTDKIIQNGWVDEAACAARLDQLIAEAVHELDIVRAKRAAATR